MLSNQIKLQHCLFSDSAHRIHPMAGQGVNMGFGDVLCLVNILEKAVQDGADFSRRVFLLMTFSR
jgi:ubiquinone biosynthesis monooxygenase Coq6